MQIFAVMCKIAIPSVGQARGIQVRP